MKITKKSFNQFNAHKTIGHVNRVKMSLLNFLQNGIKSNIIKIVLAILLLSVSASAQEEQTLMVGSASRQMIVFAPTGIPKDRPLVISMHGMNQTMTDQKNQTQFISVARSNNFVLVFPQAIGNHWQLGGTGDVDFILAIIDDMQKKFGIDRNRVYLSGFSMGGMMTYYAATKIADKIAAYAPVSGFLMGGPDTHSSRPIPIIHIHGADDTYVPYSRVQECMDAWIKRDGCPTTAKISNPYPTDKSTAKSIKYYWGPGKEGVELVVIGVTDVGHWYSDNSNDVFTSQEIWNFCSKYSLKIGVPEFVSASVSNSKPKQIKLTLSTSIADSVNLKGFIVKINNQAVIVNNVARVDSNNLVINLKNSIVKSDDILLSYSNGNVWSLLSKKLADFKDKPVDNSLAGASPRIIEVITNTGGDTLKVKLNKKMLLPASLDEFALTAVYKDNRIIPLLKCAVSKSDSSILLITLGHKVYRDYQLTLAYSGANVASVDSGMLKPFLVVPVTNIANGLPSTVKTAKLNAEGYTLDLKFSKPMLLTTAQLTSLAIVKNFTVRSVVKSFSIQDSSIIFKLTDAIHYGDTVRINYIPGTMKAEDNGLLTAFTRLIAQSDIQAPNWITIPGKIEAENFTFKSGMQAETTTDTGGGQDMGYIGTGDWAEYAIDNTTTVKDFQILFRLSALSAGGTIDYYLDETKIGSFNVPATGDWQVFQSIDMKMIVNPGKHYIKIVAKTTGFNFNYMDVKALNTALTQVNAAEKQVYFNTSSSKLEIKTNAFNYNKNRNI